MKENKIPDEAFKKTEGMLYRYYRYKKEQVNIKYKIEFLEKQIKDIDNRIQRTDVSVTDYYKTSPIEERVQTSTNTTGYAEQQIIKAIEDLENQKIKKKKKILKLTYKEKEIEEFIYNVEININQLGPKEKKFIEYRYKDKYPVLQIYKIMREEFNLEQSRFYVIRDNLISNIAHWMNIVK